MVTCVLPHLRCVYERHFAKLQSMPWKPRTHRPQRTKKPNKRSEYSDAARVYDLARGSAAARGYDRRWRKVRKAKLGRQPLCERCKARGIATPAIEVDHIVPIREGGAPYAMKNLASICRRCHLLKHRRAREDRHTDNGTG